MNRRRARRCWVGRPSAHVRRTTRPKGMFGSRVIQEPDGQRCGAAVKNCLEDGTPVAIVGHAVLVGQLLSACIAKISSRSFDQFSLLHDVRPQRRCPAFDRRAMSSTSRRLRESQLSTVSEFVRELESGIGLNVRPPLYSRFRSSIRAAPLIADGETPA